MHQVSVLCKSEREIVDVCLGPMYDATDEDDYDKSRRMSLTQAYRRNSDQRQPISNINRRLPINNGNHPNYKVRNLL